MTHSSDRAQCTVRSAFRSKIAATLAVGALGVTVISGGVGATVSRPGEAGRGDTCRTARRHPAGTEALTFDQDGVERSYNLTVPEGYDGEQKAPVILSFHGLGSNKDEQDSIGIPTAAGKRGYIVVTPQALPADLPIGDAGDNVTIEFWNIFPVTPGPPEAAGRPLPEAADDIGFVNDLVTSLRRDLCIDADRVYLTGVSLGAAMTMQMACLSPRRFAAAAPVAGVNITNECPAKQPIPVVAVHGDADALAVYEGGTVAGQEVDNPGVEQRMAQIAKIDQCAPKPTVDDASPAMTVRTWKKCAPGNSVLLYTLIGGGHTWPRGEPLDATEAILDFFDAHGGS